MEKAFSQSDQTSIFHLNFYYFSKQDYTGITQNWFLIMKSNLIFQIQLKRNLSESFFNFKKRTT